MKTRRDFLKDLSMGTAMLTVPTTLGCFPIKTIETNVPLKSKTIKTALVLWYSQTGYTETNARLIAKTFQTMGIRVTSSHIDEYSISNIAQFDLIVLGSPVFYYDTPEYVKNWIKKLPDITGTAVASFVTFGGPEGNQHNAACSILELFAQKNGVPVGLNTFMNMGTYPLSWASEDMTIPPKQQAKWKHSHLPNKQSYENVRQYAKTIIAYVEQGQSNQQFTKKMTLREFTTYLGPIFWTKRSIKNHSIQEDTCITCGLCVEKCPTDAIDLKNFHVDTEVCVLCFGCINNCPVNAVHMEYKDKKLIGYQEFMKQRKFNVLVPPELLNTKDNTRKPVI